MRLCSASGLHVLDADFGLFISLNDAEGICTLLRPRTRREDLLALTAAAELYRDVVVYGVRRIAAVSCQGVQRVQSYTHTTGANQCVPCCVSDEGRHASYSDLTGAE